MPKNYKHFEKRYKDNQRIYKGLKSKIDKNKKNKSLPIDINDLNLTKIALKLIVNKYDLLREESSEFLNDVEKNSFYNIFHFVNEKYEKDCDFLPLMLQLEAKYFNISKNIIASEILLDKERLYIMKTVSEFEIDPEYFQTIMIKFDRLNLLQAVHYLSEWFYSKGVVSKKERFEVILLTLSKIMMQEKIESSVIYDMNYKDDLSEQLLELYNNPEKLDLYRVDDESVIEFLKIIHILAFFAYQLDF